MAVDRLLRATDNNKKRIVGLLERSVKANKGVHERIKDNHDHYFNHENKNPPLADVFEPSIKAAAERNQTTILFEKTVELSSRMTENHFQWNITSPDISGDAAAGQTSELLNSWTRQIEKRMIASIQQLSAFDQIISRDAVLHLYRMDERYPNIPEYEYTDEVPEGRESDFKKDGERFKETEESRLKRVRASRARAGCPYQIDVVPRVKFSGVRDRLGRYAFGAIVEEQGYWQYDDAINAENDVRIAVEEGVKMARKLRVYGAEKFPEDTEPGLENITVAYLMTRDSWYELVATKMPSSKEDWDEGDWEIVKSGNHSFGKCTFYPVNALVANVDNELDRFMPAFEAMIRRKPGHDRDIAITKALAEMYAANEMVMTRQIGSPGETTVDGKVTGMSENADGVTVLPEGWTPHQIKIELSQAWMTMLQESRQSLEDSVPPTGFAAISEATKPWTAQLNIAQASTLARLLISNLNDALEELGQDWLRDMSLGRKNGGLDDEFFSFKYDGEGNANPKQIIGIKAKQIETLQVGVSINAATAAEQITLSQTGAELYERGIIHDLDLYENYMHKENAPAYMADKDARKLANMAVAQYLQLKVAEEFGQLAVIGANLDVFRGDPQSGGVQQVDIMDDLARQGYQDMGTTPGDLTAQPPPGVVPPPDVPG